MKQLISNWTKKNKIMILTLPASNPAWNTITRSAASMKPSRPTMPSNAFIIAYSEVSYKNNDKCFNFKITIKV